MPREGIHFLVASRALRGLPQFHPVKDLVLLGSVAHDAPYYLGGGGSPFEKVSLELHGTDGEDTLTPLFKLLERAGSADISRETAEQICAFAAGMATHAATDIVFHPLVYFKTGDYFDQDPDRRDRARSAHRRFEAELDLGAREIDSTPAPYISALLRSQQKAVRKIVQYLPVMSSHPTSTAQNWSAGLRDLGRADRLFRSNIFTTALSLSKGFAPKKLLQALDLTLPDKTPAPADTRFEFKNPVTGQPGKASLRELCDESVKLSERLIAQLFKGDHSEPGLSLNFGVVGAGRRDAKYFAKDV